MGPGRDLGERVRKGKHVKDIMERDRIRRGGGGVRWEGSSMKGNHQKGKSWASADSDFSREPSDVIDQVNRKPKALKKTGKEL